MKKIITLLIVVFVALNIAGCEPLKKKFTRKKKNVVKMPRIYQVQKYIKKPTPELYQKHYAYWRSFQAEMLSTLGQSHKRDMMCIEQIITNLQDMQNMLVPEKGDELKKHIDRLVRIKDIVTREELSQFNSSYVRSTLEREERFVKREFYYDKVKKYFKTSFEDEAK